MTDTPKTHAETADAIVERAKARGKGMVIVDREYEELENDIATALRDEYERGLTIGFDRGQGWAKTREGAMERAGLVFDGEDKIVTRSGKILDSAGNVRRVLGKLFVLASGEVVMPGAEVCHPGATCRFFLQNDGTIPLAVRNADDTDWRDADVSECYSTKEAAKAAALHAKDAHAG